MTQTALTDLTIPEGDPVIGERGEREIATAVALISSGAKPESVIRTIYLFGFMDGMLRA